MSNGKMNGFKKWIVSIVFLAGIAYATIYFNSKRITQNVVDIKDVQEKVRKIDVIEMQLKTMGTDIGLIKRAVIK